MVFLFQLYADPSSALKELIPLFNKKDVYRAHSRKLGTDVKVVFEGDSKQWANLYIYNKKTKEWDKQAYFADGGNNNADTKDIIMMVQVLSGTGVDGGWGGLTQQAYQNAVSKDLTKEQRLNRYYNAGEEFDNATDHTYLEAIQDRLNKLIATKTDENEYKHGAYSVMVYNGGTGAKLFKNGKLVCDYEGSKLDDEDVGNAVRIAQVLLKVKVDGVWGTDPRKLASTHHAYLSYMQNDPTESFYQTGAGGENPGTIKDIKILPRQNVVEYFVYKSRIPQDRLQEVLSFLGNYGEPKVDFTLEDGKLTEGTAEQFYQKVILFQMDHNLKVDGLIGYKETAPALLKSIKEQEE